MPKITDYPRASLKNSLELANAIDGLGGKCSEEMAADALHKKVSGAFHALVGAAGKYELVTKKSGQLETTPLYRSMKLAYTDEEANQRLIEAFLSPPLFLAVYEQFLGRALPIGHFEKLFIREFQVPDNLASRVAGYFIDGARQCSLLGEGNKLLETTEPVGNKDENEDETDSSEQFDTQHNRRPLGRDIEPPSSTHSHFAIKITGPGTNFTLDINEPDDLLIVQAMLKKVEKSLTEGNQE